MKTALLALGILFLCVVCAALIVYLILKLQDEHEQT